MRSSARVWFLPDRLGPQGHLTKAISKPSGVVADRKAASSGFKAAVTKGIVLNVNDRIRVAFQMKLGTVSETASLEGSSSLLNDFVRDRAARNPDGGTKINAKSL